ncbi:MAG TPA: trypsin-like peptidase domain-containing protein [Methylotenera sp.]|nr:trypsin-like peptidase domain-containing protein [Methylotenera sp.]HPH04554.1 trypsin-like peptidase domain-containing protein [Methylotenera sp.]HPN00772.1 trypsin-like peptidase domain-containing protein [Methylotenera sp.]
MKLASLRAWTLLFAVQVAQAQPVAEPSDAFIYQLKESLVKVAVNTKSGGHGFGTGVTVTKDHIVTNCHVVENTKGISVSKWGVEYAPVSMQADWKHDLCILKFEWADFKPVKMAENDAMHYEQAVISISMPSDSPAPYVELSAIKALYPMDDGEVIRTKAAFAIGASGSPVFDYAGNLIGISTFKSPGRQAYFYNMPVKWVRALLQQPASKLNSEHDLPFWDAPEMARPFFMRIVLPYQNNRWQDVQAIAQSWVTAEPNNAEAWFYLAAAAQYLSDAVSATQHYQKALALHPNHPASLQGLALLAQKQGNTAEVDKIREVLKNLSADALNSLEAALGNSPCLTC